MTQASLNYDSATLSPTLATEAKRDGMARACSPEYRKALLGYARSLAVDLAINLGEISAVNVRAAFIASQGLETWEVLGNAAGSIFKGSEWEWTGKVTENNHVSRHGGLVRVWRLVSQSGERVSDAL